MQQLKGILCTPSLNPDIRRSAADQLLSLAAHQRFQPQLSEPGVVHSLLLELTSSLPNLTSCNICTVGQGELVDEQQLPGGDTQLPKACLHLLVTLVQHCQPARALMMEDPDRLVEFWMYPAPRPFY